MADNVWFHCVYNIIVSLYMIGFYLFTYTHKYLASHDQPNSYLHFYNPTSLAGSNDISVLGIWLIAHTRLLPVCL